MVPPNKKSLAIEMLEVQQPALPSLDRTSMEMVEFVVSPLPIAPLVQHRAERTPMSPLRPRGNLDNSTNDMLFLMFGDLSSQEQCEVMERLAQTKKVYCH